MSPRPPARPAVTHENSRVHTKVGALLKRPSAACAFILVSTMPFMYGFRRMTIPEFIAKWWKVELKERSAAQGRVTAVTNAIGKVTRFTYDSNGNLTDRQDAKTETTHYDYNALNRLTNVVHAGQWKASFAYDPNGNVLNHKGHEGTEVSFAYDSMNRLVATTSSVSLVTFVVKNSYDLNGNRTNKELNAPTNRIGHANR